MVYFLWWLSLCNPLTTASYPAQSIYSPLLYKHGVWFSQQGHMSLTEFPGSLVITMMPDEFLIWPVIQLFVQQIVQAESKERINAPHDWPFMKRLQMRFPKWKAGNVERIPMSWHHLIHMVYGCFAYKQSHIISMNRRSYETKSSLTSSFNLENYSLFPLAPGPLFTKR